MHPQTEADVLRSLGHLHGKVDLLLEERAANSARIAMLEKWMWSMTGGFGLCMTFLLPKIKTLIGF